MFEIGIKKVKVFEVGPRDGLQNEPDFISTENKIKLVNLLSDAGCQNIEVTSFVHPKWVPQLADSIEVLNGINRLNGVNYNALIPNIKGLERAIDAKLEEVVTIMSSSESHNMKNLNMSVKDSLAQMKEINKIAKQNNMRVRSYIATAFGCPIEGEISPSIVAEIAQSLEEYGSYEISLGDTTGMANPKLVYEVLDKVKPTLRKSSLAVHFHQSNGIEFANILASLQCNIDVIDSAAGGLGGCPYAPGATGNMATEDLIDMLHRMDIETNIDLELIRKAGEFAKSLSAYHNK